VAEVFNALVLMELTGMVQQDGGTNYVLTR
jgi:hypothetical protein